jgi:ABC-type transport system substrate-binding protein
MVSTIVALLMLSMAFSPAIAFIYPSGAQDNLFELDGPHIDQILIKKYAETTPEFQALQAGEIDITDWALDATWKSTFDADPTVRVASYGGEAGYYTFSFNLNDNPFLGNPQDPLYDNPCDPNPTAVISLRQAFGYFIDRVALCAGPGEGLYAPIFTPVPSYMANSGWVHPDIEYGGIYDALTYNPNTADPDPITVAANLLTADGFKMGGPGGKRYWDRNDNDVYDAGLNETLNIVIYSRLDKLRKGAADLLCAGLDNAAIQVAYTRYQVAGGVAWQKVMVEKDYNMYTAGWIFIGPDPDFLYDLYNWDNYYHPEDPPNFGSVGVDDPLLQTYSSNIKYAPSLAVALTNTLLFQEQFAATAAEIPLGSTLASKAFKKFYTGGNNGVPIGSDAEDKYRGKMWTHLVNEKGQGENSWWTTLNAYPANTGEEDVGMYYGDGNMVMRYGWKDNTMPQTLNPMYSSWYWESEIYGRVYDGLGGRDPMSKGPVEVPQLAQNWTVGTWKDPADLITKAKIQIIIQPKVLWSDGVEFTVDDVIYTFIDMPKELEAKGCPPPWWQPTVAQIAGFYRLDWQTVEILMKTNAVWSMNQVVGNIIVPKHLWQSYIATHTVAEIAGDFSNRDLYMLTGTGPFLYIENTPSTALLRRNPLYCHTIQNVGKIWDHTYGGGYTYANGVTTTAIVPSTQIVPAKIKEIAGTGHVAIVAPVTNLNERFNNIEHIVITLKKFDGTLVETLFDGVYNFAAGETKAWLFNRDLPKGFYKVEISIEITGGPKWTWVHAELDPLLWPMLLGPATFGWKFSITVPGDLNENGGVNIQDIVYVALAFGTQIGGAGYNPTADLNRDGKVNIVDIVLVALDFGWVV